MTNRCNWVTDNPLYIDYHDQEWGKVQFDSQKLFEQLCLEGQQAGLSWITVLKKRAAYRQAFYGFDPVQIAKMGEAELEGLMQNRALIRHRGKLSAIIQNARAYLAMHANGEPFSEFIWAFVDHRPQRNHVPTPQTVPRYTPTAVAMSNALKKRGFAFVGATTCYAFMQSMGLVDDHLNHCLCKTN